MVLAQRTALIDRIVDGRYRVMRHIADGGMGSVYAAVDLRLDRDVALKVMREDLARDPSFVERFRKEARSAARLSDPHVVAVHDQGEDDGLVFLAMELVEGPTLRARMREAGALSPREALTTIADVLAALAVAHRAGIVHRDVKPENVLVSFGGVVKVADFGLARAVTSTTATALSGTVMGTVAYLAPEQVERGIADARSDVYAAGLMLHEMLTGRPAIEGSSPIHVAYQHVHGTLPKPSDQAPGLPPELDELVVAATRRDPDERPDDAAAWAAQVLAVRDALSDAQLDAVPERLSSESTESSENSDASGSGERSERHDRADAADSGRPDPTNETTTLARSTRLLDVRAARAGAAAVGAAPAPATPALPSVHAATTTSAAKSTTRHAARPKPGSDPAASSAHSSGGANATADPSDSTGGAPPSGATPSRDGSAGSDGRRRRLLSIGGPILLLLLVLGWYFGIGPGSERPVPTVTGVEQIAAVGRLEEAGLRTSVTEEYSETVPKGTVIESRPGPGTEAARWSTVTLAVSKGPERYGVPDVLNRSPEEAAQLLKDTKLDVGSTGRGYSETVPAGKVMATDPKAGTSLKPGTKVGLTVSRGRQPIVLESWVGRSANEAARTLREAGLKVSVTGEEFSKDVRKGSVISQDPTPRTLYRGDLVGLVVSKGPDLVAVPNVRGKNEAEARSILRAAGFEVETERIAGGLFGTAHSTDPGAGKQAPRGSTITLRIV